MIRKGKDALNTAVLVITAMLTGRGIGAQERPTVERRVVVAPGVSLHVVDAGASRSNSASVVLIPGWSTGATIWHDVITELKRTRRVIAVDPRSQGESTVTLHGNTPEQRAKDLHVLLNRLRVARPVLVGWSQGAQDVAAFVSEFGDTSVSGLVFVDSPVSDGAAALTSRPTEAEPLFRRIALYETYQPEYLDGMFKAIMLHASVAQRRTFVTTGMRTPTSIGISELLADFYGPDRTAVLAKIKVPTLVVASAQSPELESQRLMAGRIAGARFETVADAGHAVFIDQPAQFNALLAEFLH